MDYTVHGVAKSRTRLSNFHFTNLLQFFFPAGPCELSPNSQIFKC